MGIQTHLDAAFHAGVDSLLGETDRLLDDGYPGDDGSRQPVHTVYVPADTFTADLTASWSARAFEAVDAQGGLQELCSILQVPEQFRKPLADKVAEKLSNEPIEDLRIDFEDGYGQRSDAEEDAEAQRVARLVSETAGTAKGAAFMGIRFKCFEESTRARALRTLDIFVSELAGQGGLPDGLVLTLPKVSTGDQVQAMIQAVEVLEKAHGLTPGRLRFEVQMETPQLIIGPDGTHPVARLLHTGGNRVSALHYGTYDYSASLEIAAAYQSMEHPAADFAKNVMQVAVAGTGVRLSDGSTNVLPLGSPENIRAAWTLHARLVRRSLERGYYQGWDLHPAQLPTRFAATFLFYLEGFSAAAQRLHNYVNKVQSSIMDEPATARALARFIDRGHACGALSAQEIEEHTTLSIGGVRALAHPKQASNQYASNQESNR